MIHWLILIHSAKGIDATFYQGSEEGAHLYKHRREQFLGIAYWDTVEYRIVRVEDILTFVSAMPWSSEDFTKKYAKTDTPWQ